MGGNGVDKGVVRIEAKPEAIEIDPARTALVIVDMQNVFAGRGDSMRQSGQDTSGITRAIERTRRLAEAARASAIGVFYVVMIKDPEGQGPHQDRP
jgi:ureidoacrylate peracid hydrolase